jgi:anti-sigma B factor antagonist
MQISNTQLDRVTVVHLTGEIDAYTVVGVQDQLMPLVQPDTRLLLDMRDVSYMSSSGLRMLLSVYRRVSSSNGTIALAQLSDELLDTMAMTGFLRYFTVYATLEQGLNSMR